jgi:hypothetical protein
LETKERISRAELKKDKEFFERKPAMWKGPDIRMLGLRGMKPCMRGEKGGGEGWKQIIVTHTRPIHFFSI